MCSLLVVQGNQKVSVPLIITIKDGTVVFKVSPASLQTFAETPNRLAADSQGQWDTRLTLPPSDIPNSNYVIVVIDRKCLNYFCLFFTVIIKCTATF
jgi:hypothetical protein